MRIPVGCSIDRKTGERKDRYRECTPEEAQAFAAAILRAAAEARRETERLEKINQKGETV